MAASSRVLEGSLARAAAALRADTTAEYCCDSASLAWVRGEGSDTRGRAGLAGFGETCGDYEVLLRYCLARLL